MTRNIKNFIKNLICHYDYIFHKSRGSKVIFYHDVGNNYTDMGTPLSLIEEHVRIIRQADFHIVPFISKPADEIMICFDDGWEGIYENRHFFMANDIKPTIFLAVDLIGKKGYLNSIQISELKSLGFIFEGHTWSHMDLTTLSEKELIHEIVESRIELEKIIGGKIQALCFPCGRYSDAVLQVARNAGYEKLFSSINGNYYDLLKEGLICRVLTQDMTPANFRCTLLSTSPYWHRRTKNIHYVSNSRKNAEASSN